jgi:PLD-like domain
MEFVANPLTGSMLINVANTALDDCTEVRAAIPYVEHGVKEILLFDDCKRLGKKLSFYGRNDASTPIATKVLKWFIDHKNPNLSCRLVSHWLHAKVIWWVDSGVYIGSANLTDRAWYKNYEVGLFLTHAEIEQAGLTPELEAFFNALEERSHDIRDEDLKFHLELEKKREKLMAQLRQLESEAENNHPELKNKNSVISVDARKIEDIRNEKFRSEWNETLQKIRTIAHRVALPENRPHWIDASVPAGVQADQFLHAYYYKYVNPKTEKNAYLRQYEKHKHNPEAALVFALSWWKKADYDYEHEKATIEGTSKRLRALVDKGRILTLSQDEWVEALSSVYAFGDHAKKISNSDLGLGAEPGSHAKILRMAELLYTQRTISNKRSAQEVLDYVIWGPGHVADRIWNADSTNKDFKVRHLGKSFYGEVVGWARPDEFPPRNSRSSKALRCLGLDVKVYGG